MKFLFAISFLVTSSFVIDAELYQPVETELDPCPSSPNCVSTQAVKRSKKMKPIPFTGSVPLIVEQLEAIMTSYDNVTLVKKKGNYLHYEFLTKIGKFIDDVEFLIDDEEKVIHFRSASRKGYGDFGKNKRRMKKISKDWGNRVIH